MKNYLIIGGSSGIGKELVNLLEADHETVFATYHTHELSSSNQTTYLPFNVLSDTLDTDKLPEKIDGLVYCPGSINLKPFNSFSENDFLNDYKISFLGAMKTIQSVLPRLKKADQASIVLFSTVAVQSGFNFHSLVSSSKGAIEGFARALSAELAPNIRVNVVAPSLTDTPLAEKLLSNEQRRKVLSDQNPLKRVGTTTDIANAAHYLLSSKASYMTGQVIHVDGGMSIIKN